VYSWPIAEISAIQRKAVQRDVPEEETEDEEKKRWLPGGRWREPSSPSPSPFTLPFPIAVVVLLCLSIFPRTQHVVPAFIIIVIIISANGPLMNRCEGRQERFGGNERKRRKRRKKKEEKTIPRQQEQQEAYARGGPSGEDKMVKKDEEKVVTGRGRGRGREDGAPIAGFVVGLLVICSFDIIASELFSA